MRERVSLKSPAVSKFDELSAPTLSSVAFDASKLDGVEQIMGVSFPQSGRATSDGVEDGWLLVEVGGFACSVHACHLSVRQRAEVDDQSAEDGTEVGCFRCLAGH